MLINSLQQHVVRKMAKNKENLTDISADRIAPDEPSFAPSDEVLHCPLISGMGKHLQFKQIE